VKPITEMSDQELADLLEQTGKEIWDRIFGGIDTLPEIDRSPQSWWNTTRDVNGESIG